MYKLPQNLAGDIERLASLADSYANKQIENVQFKAYRVPMGIYEQRKDGVYMSRIRTTGGVISPRQFLGVIDVALANGSDLLHITTRQEIQIQNVDISVLKPILTQLKDVDLATKGGGGNTIRNIIVSEDSGISPKEAFDLTPHAIALTSRLIAEDDSYLLPRKLKAAFSSDAENIGYAGVNDLGFVAKIEGGVRGFTVFVGGGGGSRPTVAWKLFDFVPETDLFIVAEAVKKFFSEHGNRKNRSKARIRYIFYKLGDEQTLDLIRGYYEQAKSQVEKYSYEAFENERPDADYVGAQGLDVDAEKFGVWKSRYASEQKQKGYYSILVPVALGNISLKDEGRLGALRNLLNFIERFGEHTVRFTTSQSIRLRNIPQAALEEIYFILKGLVANIDAPLFTNNIVSCTGADTCRLGLCFSKGLASAIGKETAKIGKDLDKLGATRVNISGCPNSCGQHFWSDIGFSGRVLRNERVYPGYQIHLAADRRISPKLAEPIGVVNARDLPKFVRRLAEAYIASESTVEFGDYLKAEGGDVARRLVEEYKDVPSFSEDKNYYYDWEAETPFAVAGGGAPECSAGLFDMIDLDLERIKEAKAALADESDADKAAGLVYDIAFSASRMLLVTRGADPKSTEETFNLFIEKLIEAGIVDSKYRRVVELARNGDKAALSAERASVIALSEIVSELYKNMDQTLQFKGVAPAKTESQVEAEKAKETAPTISAPAAPDKFKDLRKVACPMNFVQTKIALSSMKEGQVLEIWLDDGPPIENVPGSVLNEGHAVESQTRADDHWKVLIRKKRS